MGICKPYTYIYYVYFRVYIYQSHASYGIYPSPVFFQWKRFSLKRAQEKTCETNRQSVKLLLQNPLKQSWEIFVLKADPCRLLGSKELHDSSPHRFLTSQAIWAHMKE